MCCILSCFIKWILGIAVTILMILGIILMVIGALLMWGFNIILRGISILDNQLNEFMKQLSIDGDVNTVINLMATNASSVGSAAFAIGIILVGFSVIMTILICCCPLKYLFILIAAILGAFIIALIVVVSVYGSNSSAKVINAIEKYLQTGIINKYKGLTDNNPESIITNVVHITMQCCGLSNYQDFNSASEFNRTYVIDKESITLIFPVSCCNYDKKFFISNNGLIDCLKNKRNNHSDTGCWTLVKPLLEKNFKKVIATLTVTIVILVAILAVLILFICCLDKLP